MARGRFTGTSTTVTTLGLALEGLTFFGVVAVLHDVSDGFFHGKFDLAEAGALEAELGGYLPHKRLGQRQTAFQWAA